ncbi:MAG TPA: HAD family hydrolase [Candidatus Mediterraneibacter ornithocaccae]|nr:HAD family hydrolase [Candidatus Mediterraneibacter ornithocaccae]
MSIKHILFDLDGTLLPMVQDEFVKFYMPLLAKSYMGAGVSLDPKKFIGAVWAGYEAMVKNDGSRTNREAFWSYMEPELPISTEESENIALKFYENEFNQAICTTKPTPVSNQIVKKAKSRGLETYLATNPVFPQCATMNRIRWAGLVAEDFKVITTYETCTYCKPNPEYFRGILEEFSLDPSECLMVGNDVEEDLAIRSLGVKTYLVTDTMENKKDLPVKSDYIGTLEELLKFIETVGK